MCRDAARLIVVIALGIKAMCYHSVLCCSLRLLLLLCDSFFARFNSPSQISEH